MTNEIKRDINSIIIMLATQGMINLGEIKDPVTGENVINLDGAQLFVELLDVLHQKTQGNLSQEEETFFNDVLGNIKKVYQSKKKSAGN